MPRPSRFWHLSRWTLGILFASLSSCGGSDQSSSAGGHGADTSGSPSGGSMTGGSEPGTGGAGADTTSSGGAAASSSGSGGGPSIDGGEATYEAERAFWTGTGVIGREGDEFTGEGYITGLASAAARVTFTVHQLEEGPVDATVRYRHSGVGTARFDVRVNGLPSAGLELAASGEAFTEISQSLALRRGLNTVTYVPASEAPGNVAFDHLVVPNALATPARGATGPFWIVEAEAQTTNGTILGPDRSYLSVAAECSSRRAVRLEEAGSFIELTLTDDANAIVVRYSMADAPTGGGLDGELGLYVDDELRAKLPLSSKYAWVYGAYPYGNDPNEGAPHRFFDEVRALVGDLPAGARIRLQKEAGDVTPYYVIDLIEFELVDPPLPMPDGALTIEDYGATPNDDSDDTEAIRQATAAGKAENKPVWIPEGNYRLTQKLDIDSVAIRGAGPWHSVLHGSNGKGGFNELGGEIGLFDFAIFGDVTYRDDDHFDSGFDGKLGANSLVQNMWFEHTKVGIWTIGAEQALITGVHIRNTFADGINLNGGSKRVVVEHVTLRNTGDDGLAMWSDSAPNEGNVFRYNSATLPMLANGIAIYGGTDNAILDCTVSDTVTAAAGIALSTRAEFSPLPFSGTTRVERSTLVRTGGYEENWKAEFGGLWIFANLSAISGIEVRDVEILDSTYSGILLSGEHSVTGVTFERVTIDGATYGVEIPTTGSATFRDVVVSRATRGGSQINEAFEVVREGTTDF